MQPRGCRGIIGLIKESSEGDENGSHERIVPATAIISRMATGTAFRGRAPNGSRAAGRRISDGNFSQMHYARKGLVTEEMDYVADREKFPPNWFATK